MRLGRLRFVRAPPDYYSRPLAGRAAVLGGCPTSWLCKTILMENTRCTQTDCAQRRNSRWCVRPFVVRPSVCAVGVLCRGWVRTTDAATLAFLWHAVSLSTVGCSPTTAAVTG